MDLPFTPIRSDRPIDITDPHPDSNNHETPRNFDYLDAENYNYPETGASQDSLTPLSQRQTLQTPRGRIYGLDPHLDDPFSERPYYGPRTNPANGMDPVDESRIPSNVERRNRRTIDFEAIRPARTRLEHVFLQDSFFQSNDESKPSQHPNRSSSLFTDAKPTESLPNQGDENGTWIELDGDTVFMRRPRPLSQAGSNKENEAPDIHEGQNMHERAALLYGFKAFKKGCVVSDLFFNRKNMMHWFGIAPELFDEHPGEICNSFNLYTRLLNEIEHHQKHGGFELFKTEPRIGGIMLDMEDVEEYYTSSDEEFRPRDFQIVDLYKKREFPISSVNEEEPLELDSFEQWCMEGNAEREISAMRRQMGGHELHFAPLRVPRTQPTEVEEDGGVSLRWWWIVLGRLF